MYRGLYYDSGWGGEDYGGGGAGESDPTQVIDTHYDSSPTGADYAPSNYGASGTDVWQGWEKEISIHSAGLEYYTAPTKEGEPGITTLTDAGLKALGITREQAPVTLSWGAPLATKQQPITPSYNFLGFDLTALMQGLVSGISAKIDALSASMEALSKTIGDPVKAQIDALTKSVSNTIGTVITTVRGEGVKLGNTVTGALTSIQGIVVNAVSEMSATVTGAITTIQKSIGNIANEAGQYLSAVFFPLLDSVRNGLAYVQNALNAITTTIKTTIQSATDAASAAIQVTLSQLTSGLTEIQDNLKGLPDVVKLFATPESFGDFFMSALLAAWQKEA